jgi:hypothetical protein
MGQAYGINLRTRVVEAIAGSLSHRQAAERFLHSGVDGGQLASALAKAWICPTSQTGPSGWFQT